VILPDRLRPALLSPPASYGPRGFAADAVAGLTVAVVALPLSMAIAIASGLNPGTGLVTAIVGGFVVSALGGSRHQIGGPAGAFIVLVAGTVHQHGADGLATATLVSGALLAVLGLCGAGALVRRVPQAVTLGFMAAIAAIIATSQIAPLLGLALADTSPDLRRLIPAVGHALPGANPWAIALAGLTVATVVACRRLAPRAPALLTGVAVATLAGALPALPVDTIGTRFGAMPAGLPGPALPDLSLIPAVLPAAVAFTLLGAIESLLSATVADRMTGERHRPDAELVGQGAANAAAALFGGFPVTGTIARTATNVRAGGVSPVAGMLHAAVLWTMLVAAGPLALHIPLAALAAVLILVAWGMIERTEILHLARHDRGGLAVAGVTLAVTLVWDLIAGIAAGCALALILAAARRRGSGSPADRAPP
jgi:sulfate permease, SulP family